MQKNLADSPKTVKKVAPRPEVVNATQFECSQCEFTTRNLGEQLEHERGNTHIIASGNYPCPRCKKIVTIVPDYIDKPAPDSGLPEDNTKEVHKRFNMVKKKPSTASARGNSGYCDDCKTIVKKELFE